MFHNQDFCRWETGRRALVYSSLIRVSCLVFVADGVYTIITTLFVDGIFFLVFLLSFVCLFSRVFPLPHAGRIVFCFRFLSLAFFLSPQQQVAVRSTHTRTHTHTETQTHAHIHTAHFLAFLVARSVTTQLQFLQPLFSRWVAARECPGGWLRRQGLRPRGQVGEVQVNIASVI